MLRVFASIASAVALSACATVENTPAPADPISALDAYYATVDDSAWPVAGEGPALPAANAVLETLAFGSCNDQEDAIPILRQVVAQEPDLFVYMGDNVYGDAYSGNMELYELEQAYADLAANPDFAALRASTPMLATWDDHDYGMNDAGGDFSAKYLAERMFDRFWGPENAAGSAGHEGVYQSRTFGPEGQRVQLIMLDTRFFRSTLRRTDEEWAEGKERYMPDPDPAKTMLGEAQWAWLEAQLQEPADVRFVLSSIQVHAEGHGWEAWRTLPTERDRLYAMLEEAGAENTILISGDRHMAALYERAVGDVTAPEMTTSSLNLPFNDEVVRSLVAPLL